MRHIFISLSISLALYANNSVITLSEAYQRALSYEAKLRSVAYQVDAKKEDVKIAESQLYPQIYASLDHSDRQYKDNFYKNKTKRL